MDHKQGNCRFIPDRRCDGWDHFFVSSPPGKSIEQKIRSFRNRNYEQVLRQLFKIPVPEQRLLFPSIKPLKEYWENRWPARPRKKPYIGAPHMILDLPLFNNDMFMNTIDWGPFGLACALASTLYFWKESQSVVRYLCVKEENEIITAVKCHPTDTIIAIGTTQSRVKVWNTVETKHIFSTFCCLNSTINSLEWHPTELSLVSGCTNGCLLILYLGDISRKEIIRNIHDAISVILFSQSGDSMATTDPHGRLVLWDWNTKQPIADVVSLSTCKAFSWHPWKSILAIGTNEDDGTIHIVYTKTERKMVYKSETPMKVLNLTWSKVTGELVANVLLSYECGSETNVILIFGCLGEIVDKIDVCDVDGHCSYLLWSPDGYQLGTVTPSEVLMIWKFCEKRGRISKARSTSKEASLFCILESIGGISSTIR